MDYRKASRCRAVSVRGLPSPQAFLRSERYAGIARWIATSDLGVSGKTCDRGDTKIVRPLLMRTAGKHWNRTENESNNMTYTNRASLPLAKIFHKLELDIYFRELYRTPTYRCSDRYEAPSYALFVSHCSRLPLSGFSCTNNGHVLGGVVGVSGTLHSTCLDRFENDPPTHTPPNPNPPAPLTKRHAASPPTSSQQRFKTTSPKASSPTDPSHL